MIRNIYIYIRVGAKYSGPSTQAHQLPTSTGQVLTFTKSTPSTFRSSPKYNTSTLFEYIYLSNLMIIIYVHKQTMARNQLLFMVI